MRAPERASVESEEQHARRQFLTFFLGADEFGVAIGEVLQILAYPEVTRMPQLPPAVRGVMNLRGSVVPVIDLALKLGLGTQPVTSRSCVVVVDAGAIGSLGIVADRVHRALELAEADLVPPPELGLPVRTDYLLGLGRCEKRFVLLLDTARLLSPAELLATAEGTRALAAPEPR